MTQCKYKYDLEDNLNVAKELSININKKRTSIVTLLVIFLSIVGVIVSINAIANNSQNWWVGILSVVLIAGYFLVDKIGIKIQLKKQEKFYYSSNLKDITNVTVTLDNETLTEELFSKEKSLGTNRYKVDKITSIKVTHDNIFIFIEDRFVVLVKRKVLTQKEFDEFMALTERFQKPKKVKKIK